MDLKTLILTIASSSLVATILTSIINLYLKKVDFKNEYFKIVIRKRLEAYEKLEYLIAAIKTSALDEIDQLPYHVCFFNSQNFMDYSGHLVLANSYNLWLNSEINQKLDDLNYIFNQLRFEFDITVESQLILAGKKYYLEIARLRTDIENMARKDILTLYDFGGISKKIVKNEYQIIKVKKERIEKLRQDKGQSPNN